MKLKNLLKGCMNTVDSVRILGISIDESPMYTCIKDIYTLSDTKIELTVYVKYGTGES